MAPCRVAVALAGTRRRPSRQVTGRPVDPTGRPVDPTAPLVDREYPWPPRQGFSAQRICNCRTRPRQLRPVVSTFRAHNANTARRNCCTGAAQLHTWSGRDPVPGAGSSTTGPAVHRVRPATSAARRPRAVSGGVTPQHLVRAARQMARLSQRQLAQAAEVSERTVADVERGTVMPNAATLARLLAAAGFQLTLDRAAPEPDARLRRYLGLTLSQRLLLALGVNAVPSYYHAPWRQLDEVARCGPTTVVGEAAHGVWIPVAAERGEVVVAPRRRLPDGLDRLHVHVVADPPSDPSAVPVSVQRSVVRVLPPHALALSTADVERRLALHTAAALLDAEAGRDDGGRRAPAHRDVDRRRDHVRVMHTKALAGQPVPADHRTRGWQLGGAVSLRQWLVAEGLQPGTMFTREEYGG